MQYVTTTTLGGGPTLHETFNVTINLWTVGVVLALAALLAVLYISRRRRRT